MQADIKSKYQVIEEKVAPDTKEKNLQNKLSNLEKKKFNRSVAKLRWLDSLKMAISATIFIQFQI